MIITFYYRFVAYFFLILLNWMTIQSQQIRDGFYENDKHNSFCFVQKDTLWLSYPATFGTSEKIIKNIISDNGKMFCIIPQNKLATQMKENYRKVTEGNSIVYFKVYDFYGHEIKDTVNCMLNYTDTMLNKFSSFVKLYQKNESYFFNYNNFSFTKATLEIDYFYNHYELMDKIDRPTFVLYKNSTSCYDILLAPLVNYTCISEKIKYQKKDEKIYIFFTKEIDGFPENHVEKYSPVEKISAESIIQFIFNYHISLKPPACLDK